MELLVVIAIIMILIGILLPSLQSARAAGHKTVCMSNQSQITRALGTYMGDYNDLIPREGTVDGRIPEWRRAHVSWAVALRPNLDSRLEAGREPDDLFADAEYYRDPARKADGHRIHFVSNAFPFLNPNATDLLARDLVNDGWRFRRGVSRMEKILQPETTAYLTELGDDSDRVIQGLVDQAGPTDLEKSVYYDVWDPLHIQKGSSLLRVGLNRHGRFGNIAYMDGHVATVASQDMQKLATWDDRDYGSKIAWFFNLSSFQKK